MTNLWRVRSWVLIPISILLTLVFGFMAVGCGAGHGDCSWILYFFPLMGLLTVIGAPGFLILLGILQFPLYAIILMVAIAKQRTKPAVLGLIAFHVLAVVIVFYFD